MLVTKIAPLGKTRFQVYLEEKPALVLYKGDLKKYGISEGIDISDTLVGEIKEEVLVKRAKQRALHLLNDMDRTESGLLEKLLKGGYSEDVAMKAVTYVKSFGYIDDSRYARQFIQSRMHKKSRRELCALLLGKGLSTAVIEDALQACFDGTCEKRAIELLLQKKKFDLETANEKEKKKMYDYLLRKGFRYEDIRQSLQVSSWNT